MPKSTQRLIREGCAPRVYTPCASPAPVKTGDTVRIIGREVTGTVAAITGDQVWVQWDPAFVEVWDARRLERAA